jgi:serine/threonine-protein kinase HipA
MVDREPVEVTVEIGGREVAAGTLWIHEQRTENATFRYSDTYLASPVSYDLDPALPKSAGIFQSRPGRPLFSAFEDSAPDRWGQNLMRREERERAATESRTPRTGTPYHACSNCPTS